MNLQPGQRLAINALVEHAPLVRAVAAEAYAAGARYVDVLYSDQHVRRAHIEHADDDDARLVAAVARQAARRSRRATAARCSRSPATPSPSSSPTSTAAASPRARMREVAEASLRLTERRLQLVDRRVPERGLGDARSSASPTSSGSGRRSRRPSGSTSPTRSRPGASTSTTLGRRAAALNERRFDALRYRGPGTDLTVGLHPDSVWQAALDESRGIEHVANMPTEEVFTTPDARRVDGTVARDLPAPAPGHDRPRARGPLRGRPRGRGPRRRGRGADAHARRDRRRRGAPRRGRARRRHLARRPDRARLLRHALRRERRVAHRPRRRRSSRPSTGAARALARGAPRARDQPLVDPHRLHDRLARARDLGRHRRPATRCRSSTAATGFSPDRGAVVLPSRGGQTRTADFRVPNAALYQAELRPAAPARAYRTPRGRSHRC